MFSFWGSRPPFSGGGGFTPTPGALPLHPLGYFGPPYLLITSLRLSSFPVIVGV